FFQAEDGIRDLIVTGVQTCALPILTWLRGARCIYWGDIDTHGFDILNRVRIFVPNVESILMDTDTLLRHEKLWGEEPEQCSSERSEERRVGKECISRRWDGCVKEKK